MKNISKRKFKILDDPVLVTPNEIFDYFIYVKEDLTMEADLYVMKYLNVPQYKQIEINSIKYAHVNFSITFSINFVWILLFTSHSFLVI